MLVIVRTVDTSDIELACLVGLTKAIDGKPIGVCPVKLFMGTVRIHAGKYHQTLFVCRPAEVAKKVTAFEELCLSVKGDFAGIIGNDATCIDDNSLCLCILPVLSPPTDIVMGRVFFGNVGLPPTGYPAYQGISSFEFDLSAGLSPANAIASALAIVNDAAAAFFRNERRLFLLF